MADLVNRTTGEMLRSKSTPDYDPAIWIVLDRSRKTDIPIIAAIPQRYRKISVDIVTEMTAVEKTTEDQKTCHLVLSSNAPADFDGVPVVDADNIATHTVTISKKDFSGLDARGSEVIRLILDVPMAVVRGVTLVNGQATITVGPSLLKGEVNLTAKDEAGAVKETEIKLRFK